MPRQQRGGLRQRLMRLVASHRFQSWAARFPLTRGITRSEGEAIFDLVAGFVHSQCLVAIVEFGVLDRLLDEPCTLEDLSRGMAMPRERAVILLDAGVALGLIRKRGDAYSITRRGAALSGVPGLSDMISHHAVLYRDLVDPVSFFRGEIDTELAKFWPYVFGAGAAEDPTTAQKYSRLMADSQMLVAEETLACVDFTTSETLMDVGGGTGAFLAEALEATPGLAGILFDLPAVVPDATKRFMDRGLASRVRTVGGSFRDEPLPVGADAISLVRVLYDHSDDTVRALLTAVYNALPTGGLVVVSEPMAGGEQPTRAGNAYFAVYTLAMGTGKTRSPAEVQNLLTEAGFASVRHRPTRRAFVTSVVTGVKSI
jgi:demethylspheroidene O-methyltransferase